MLVDSRRSPSGGTEVEISHRPAFVRAFIAGGAALKRIGAEVASRWVEGVKRAISARKDSAIGDGRFFDVQFADLARDPLGTVRRIYSSFGFGLSREAERRMRSFVAENPKGKHGRHDYSLARFGLDARGVRHRFKGYCEVFNVPSESAPA